MASGSREGAPSRPATRRERRWAPILAGLGLALLLLLVAFLEGDIPHNMGHLGSLLRQLVRRFGAPGSLALLYLEESGIPLPVPGDVYLLYLGSLAAGSLARWLAAWLAVTAVVVAGSSNLFLASRRWGRRLISNPRLAAALHLDRDRIERAERWFARWGPLAIIFGRHVPGFRVPITVVAGAFGVRYRAFAPSVAISTAPWSAFWLFIGARYGRSAGHFLGTHSWAYLVATLAVVSLVAYVVVRVLVSAPAEQAEAGRPR